MQRAIATDGTVSDGQDASSWTQSAPPGLNFSAEAVGIRVANPGTGSFTFADPVVDVDVDDELSYGACCDARGYHDYRNHG